MNTLTCIAAVLALAFSGAAAAQPSAPPTCAAPEYRQFDFWLGQWEVFGPAGRKLGDSRVELVASGCAVLEYWAGSGGFSGSSINQWDKPAQRWRQNWVDNSGGRLDLVGEYAQGRMVLKAIRPDPKVEGGTLTERITLQASTDGSVRQLWEQSVDGEKTWTTAFDGRYVKKP